MPSQCTLAGLQMHPSQDYLRLSSGSMISAPHPVTGIARGPLYCNCRIVLSAAPRETDRLPVAEEVVPVQRSVTVYFTELLRPAWPRSIVWFDGLAMS